MGNRDIQIFLILGNLVFDQRELQMENGFEEEKWTAY